MVEWDLAVQIFFSGIGIVMLVMFILQITVSVSSFIVRKIEKSLVKAEG